MFKHIFLSPTLAQFYDTKRRLSDVMLIAISEAAVHLTAIQTSVEIYVICGLKKADFSFIH